MESEKVSLDNNYSLTYRIKHKYETTEPLFKGDWFHTLQQQLNQHTTSKSNDYYFGSYSHYGIHEDMLRDHVRTDSYREACEGNPELFKNKVVLDIGCGTGILSIFAVKAGAKKVYGVDNADIIQAAKDIIQRNGLSSKITLIHKKIEDLEDADIPEGKVDIIISEWMGYFLLYESMLDSVIDARDKWLKKGGTILPTRVKLNVSAFSNPEGKRAKFDFWNSLYGINMKYLKYVALNDPVIEVMDRSKIVSTAYTILEIELATVSKSFYSSFAHKYRLNILEGTNIDGIVGWFDVFFDLKHYVLLSTSPFSAETHWKHTIFYLNHCIKARKGSVLRGTIAVKQSTVNFRDLDACITYHYRENAEDRVVKKKIYRLA